MGAIVWAYMAGSLKKLSQEIGTYISLILPYLIVLRTEMLLADN